MNANAFLKRMLLAGAISAFSLANVVYAHGGHGTGGSSGGGSGSSGSSSGTGGGHSASSTSSGHSAPASASKGTQSAHDPVNLSQAPNAPYQGIRVYRIFQQPASTGEYRESANDDWKRRHPHLLFGFIRY
jgi:hypothetical protein